MQFNAYQLVSDNSASLNTGSYLNRVEYSLFVKGYVSDLWYGSSANDVIELGVWDRSSQNLIGWQTLNQSKNYNSVTLSYTNTLNSSVTFSYRELEPEFILYKNEKILVNPSEQLSASFQLLSGSYFLTYNFTREMAGSPIDSLVIKDISPSRKELKLVPLSVSTPAYNAFCNKKILLSDVSSLYIGSLKNLPYSQIYSEISSQYQSEIATIQTVFFLTTEAATVQFFRNLYEDFIIFSPAPNNSIIRIQGIHTYFNNYLLSNLNNIVSFDEIDNQFKGYVSASIERKFAPTGLHPIKQYVDAKAFVYDFFTKYYYVPIAKSLSATYNEKYYSHLKNSLNLGDNRLLPIINTGVMDERAEPADSLTLLIKLQSELPSDLSIQSQCWVSNTSLSPYVLNTVVKNSVSDAIHKIGPPNFTIPIPNASLTNTNLSYTADDLKEDDDTTRELTVSKNVVELSVDYSKFENFVVFSSAELRLNIFKNKIINLSSLSSSIDVLNSRNTVFLAASGSTYPHYSREYANFQGGMNEIINSFDGYESYLYRSGDYTYRSGSFVSASYVVEVNSSASYYDKTNRDSLINNCPEHVLTNSDNDDYIIFLSMIGHFFDNIYIYIANMPSQKQVGHNASGVFTRRVIDYMLQTFGWNLDDSLEQSNILSNYLTSDEIVGLNSMSSEERLGTIRNRLLISLPQIYKTKGTEESIRLILACYGIPSSLLSIREYGGVNYTDDRASYTTYERAYMRQWDTSSICDTYYLQCPTGSHTFLFKLIVDSSEPYTYGMDQALFGKVPEGETAQSISGSGEWAVGFVRVPKKDTGKIFLRIGYIDRSTFRMESPEFPLFDGNLYSVMVRKNDPDSTFEYTTNVDSVPTVYDIYVQRNEGGTQILCLTSSKINYDVDSNIEFGDGGRANIGGWFSYWNGQGFTGCFDKFQVWLSTLSNVDFEDYVNNISSYAFSGSNPHESLAFRMHTDYPFDQRQYPSGSGVDLLGVENDNWIGIWRNGNPFYATGSNEKLVALYGMGANVDYMVNWGAWSGSQKLVESPGSCTGYVSESSYPYQFRVIDYPSTWGVSKYGPNKFRNEKIRHVSQSIEARFDDKDRSTYVPISTTAPDSNQVGFFIDPQDFKNRDIIRYLGNFDLMGSIGDPSNQFSESYSSLKTLRKEYADSHAPLSGSKTLFNELCILYKLYFNRSVFEAIKNVVPARANTLVGVLIEPTILERPKYQSKEIFIEANTGSVAYFDITASHYFKDPTSSLVRITSSFDLQSSSSIEVTYLSLPTRDYPVNYGGNYIGDYPDVYEQGSFAGGILTNEELSTILLNL